MADIKNKVSQQKTELLIESMKSLMNDFRDGSGIALDAIMDELEERMIESEFISLCEEVYDAS